MFLTQIVNGKVTELALCARCAEERGLFDPQSLTFAEKFFPEEFKNRVEKIVHEITGGEMQTKREHPSSESGDLLTQCPHCRFTLDDFRRSGRLGCPECYDIFASEMDNNAPSDAPTTEQDAPASHAMSRDLLEKRLAAAIEKEDYETAAQLRDQLKELH